ncbi:MAG: tetratricopeptide repeat protein [Ignavibacteriaceae bacterium]|nr:tetratricopeptide repeat protein [Ignavibacteriaceae bacterium]
MKKTVLIILMCLLGCISIQHAQSVTALIQKGKATLYSGYVHFDKSEMFKARGMFERALASEEKNYLGQYYLAYTDYNLAVYFMQKKEIEQFKKFSDSSEKILKKLMNENKTDAEVVSLLGALYGIQIAMNPELGSLLGSQNISLTSKALGIAPRNPRVLLQKGISKFNSPEFVGGSKQEALKYFIQSVELFENQTETETDIEWGYINSLAWLGISHFNLGDFESAINAYHKALKLEPDFAWIKYELLPKSQEKLSSSN